MLTIPMKNKLNLILKLIKLITRPIKELKNCILNHEWDFSDMDTNTAFNYFIDMFKLMVNKCCPLYTPIIISNKIKNSWINNSLLKCIHHKKKLLKLFIANKNDFNHIKYKKYRNILTSVLS